MKLILNKKTQWGTAVFLAGFLFLFLSTPASASISSNLTQVKAKNSPAVYFLSQKNHRKKTYLNATAYLSYGLKWSDVKTVSATDLNSWPEAKLFKSASAAKIYYIKGNQKVVINNLSDLISFGLKGEPVLTINDLDLAQYETVDYATLNLSGASSVNNVNSGSSNNGGNTSSNNVLSVTSEAVTGPNDNSVVAGTDGNLVGIFHFIPTIDTATITDLVLDFSGLYNSSILKNVFLLDANNSNIVANVNVNPNNRRATVHFRPALILGSGQEQVIKVFVNLGVCSTCTNQTLAMSLKEAASVAASAPVVGAWPLQNTTFKIISGTMIGQVNVQVESLANLNLTVNNGSRLIAKIKISETSGNEDVLIKKLVFENGGTANKDDWQNFRLLNGNDLVSTTSTENNDDQIVFNINYLRVTHNTPVELSVIAGLSANYHPTSTYNLQLTSVISTGNTYQFSIAPAISNLNETYPLN